MSRRWGLASRVSAAVLALAVLPTAALALAQRAVWSSAAALSTLAAAAIAGWYCRDAAERAALLDRALRRVGDGDLAVRLRPRGGDELDDALSSFNAMMDRVDLMRARSEELERIGAWQEFARRLAHEIKNPLTPIQLAVQEVARKYPGGDPAFERILGTAREVVEEEIETLRRMVTAFSEFARLPEVRPMPADLVEFVRDAAEGDALVRDASGAEAKVCWEPGEGSAPVRIDRILLRRALDNLLRNAAQAGAKHITVRVDRAAVAEGELRLVVEDDGPGVPKELRGALFEPYVTTKASSGGSGLGLAIVRKIALDHDGDVALDESFERGARFVLALPLSDATRRASTTFVTLRAKATR
jgi:two-component system nitrogen regulation sensor histidine kinase NtrY